MTTEPCARSMAIGLGDEGVIFTVVDAVGMGNQWTRSIRQQAADLTGLPQDRIVIATTHTHGGPDFQGLWGGVGGVVLDHNTTPTGGSPAENFLMNAGNQFSFAEITGRGASGAPVFRPLNWAYLRDRVVLDHDARRAPVAASGPELLDELIRARHGDG